MLWVEPMGGDKHDEDKRHPDDALWRRIREAIYKAVYAVFKPPPPDVIEKIEDVLGRAERDWKREERQKCHDEDSEKQ
jgi:hypothetical protein